MFCYFLTCYLFWGRDRYLQWVKTEAAHWPDYHIFSRIAPDLPFITGLQGQKIAKLSLQLWVNDPWVQWDHCWKHYKCNAQSRRKIWKPAEANGHLSAAFTEPENWGSKLSVDRSGGIQFLFAAIKLSFFRLGSRFLAWNSHGWPSVCLS